MYGLKARCRPSPRRLGILPKTKITDWQRLELLTLYVAGFREEACELALSLGLTKNYAGVLNNRMYRKVNRIFIQNSRWMRAIENAKKRKQL